MACRPGGLDIREAAEPPLQLQEEVAASSSQQAHGSAPAGLLVASTQVSREALCASQMVP